ncbi:DUF1844 domain-containing protein [Bacteroidota bacterium]
MEDSKNSQLFISLIYTFQMQTLVALGKLKNPMTEKTETDLFSAQTTIDMLEMLKEKTKNNLNETETKYLEQALADLKLNYVEEQAKSEKKKEEDAKEDKAEDKKEEKDAEDTEGKEDLKEEVGKGEDTEKNENKPGDKKEEEKS